MPLPLSWRHDQAPTTDVPATFVWGPLDSQRVPVPPVRGQPVRWAPSPVPVAEARGERWPMMLREDGRPQNGEPVLGRTYIRELWGPGGQTVLYVWSAEYGRWLRLLARALRHVVDQHELRTALREQHRTESTMPNNSHNNSARGQQPPIGSDDQL